MVWDIDKESGYCRSKSGTEVVLSPQRIGTYRPALGPFSSTKNIKSLAKEIAALTIAAEDSSYLLWGSLAIQEESNALATFMGFSEKWIPDPSARTRWCIEAGAWDLAMLEWKMEEPDKFHHLSGVTFSLPNRVKRSLGVTKPIAHTKTAGFVAEAWPTHRFDDALHSLGNAAARLKSSKKPDFLLPQPVF